MTNGLMNNSVSTLHEFNKPLHVCFVDLKKAYDSVNRNALWKILESLGVLEKIVGLLKDLHDETATCVKGFGRLFH